MPVVSSWEEKTEQLRRANRRQGYATEPSRGLKQRYAERKKKDEEFAEMLGVDIKHKSHR